MRSLPHTLEATMQDVADQSAAPTTIRTNNMNIYSGTGRSICGWPHRCRQAGGGRRCRPAACLLRDIAALLARFSETREKRARGPENPFQSSSFKGEFRTASGSCLAERGIESHVVDAASVSLAPAASGPEPTDRQTFAARCSPTSAVNRGSAQWFRRRRLKMKITAGFAVSARC